MKTIHLLRHAKSSWADASVSDIDRTLNSRGNRSAKLMIEPIWKAGCRFEHIYCSPAKRARATIHRMAKALPVKDVKWTVDESLYTFNAGDLLSWLRDLGNELDEVMIVGHNPAITDLVNLLGDQHIDNVPTCGYVQLSAKVKSWSKLKEDCAEVTEFIYPKLFTAD